MELEAPGTIFHMLGFNQTKQQKKKQMIKKASLSLIVKVPPQGGLLFGWFDFTRQEEG